MCKYVTSAGASGTAAPMLRQSSSVPKSVCKYASALLVCVISVIVDQGVDVMAILSGTLRTNQPRVKRFELLVVGEVERELAFAPGRPLEPYLHFDGAGKLFLQ